MKKILCILMVLVLVLPITGYGATDSADAMQEVLITVKSKVDVPDALSEFTPYSSEHAGRTSYSFSWQNEDSSSSMEVSADEKGRIQSYYTYDRNLKSDKRLTKLSKEDITAFAESFIKKTLPEAYLGGSDLVFRENSWNVNSLNYNLEFVRTYDGIEVKDNAVSIRISVYDDTAYVRSMYANINYDAEFEAQGETTEDYAAKYREAFPEEMIYTDVYSADKKDETVLLYRFKDSHAGFILATTGEVATEDPRETGDEVFDTANKEMVSASGSAREEVLTEKELEELGRIEELMSAEEAYSILQKLPHVKIDSSMKRENYNISKRDEKYTISVGYASKDKSYNLSASFDGETKELKNLYAGKYTAASKKNEITEKERKTAEKNTDEFLKAVLGDKLSEFMLVSSSEGNGRVNCDFDRTVNGIRYVNDGIYASYNTDEGMMASYNLDMEENRTFAEPNGAIDGDKAYESLMNVSPLKKVYLKTGGNYKVCFTVSEYAKEVDAFTGLEYTPYTTHNTESYNYTDIENHWAKQKIQKLAEIQIGFAGDKFRPDDGTTQAEILKLFAAGIRSRHYIDYTDEDIYREFISEGILTEEEKTPERVVSRGEAFIYMIRIAGLEEVAKLSEIFKVDYEDSDMLLDGCIGYPAILTGMGVICGNGGKLRPQDVITRAESVVMTYNYMSK